MAEQGSSNAKPKLMSVYQVIALGVGAMVGAGIFALLGQAALLVRGQTWIAFALGGLVALLSGYAYSRLGAFYPSRGGIIDFFRRGLASPVLSTALSLLYLVTLILSVAMVARAFGAYAMSLFHIAPQHGGVLKLFSVGIVVVLALCNMVSANLVGRTELTLVVIKLGILLMLLVVGAFTFKVEQLDIHHVPRVDEMVSSVGLTFFAYAGYGMMANAAEDVANPARTLPRAFMIAIGITIFFYVALAVVLLGNISPENLAKYADTAVAQAAYPMLGSTGFRIVSIGALLATASAINATLFSAFNIAYSMGQRRALPAGFAHSIWRQATGGNLVIVAIIIVLTAFLNLGALAEVASATFLICYLAVFVAAWRLRQTIEASPAILLTGMALMAIVFLGFAGSLLQKGWAPISLVVLSLLVCFVLALRSVKQQNAS